MALLHEVEAVLDQAAQLVGLDGNRAAVLTQDPPGELVEDRVLGHEHVALERRGFPRHLNAARRDPHRQPHALQRVFQAHALDGELAH